MRKIVFVIIAQALLPASRPPDVPFKVQMIDSTWTETAAVADVNNDRRLDSISGEWWYEAPSWTRHKIRDINFNGTYVDDFSDLPLDVDGDGQWTQRMIDNTWAQAHASALVDVDGDGQPDLITGKRYFARNAAADPSEREPLGLYWYEWRTRQPATPAAGQPSGGPALQPTIEWVRHFIDYGGRAGGGLQIVARDLDGDGDLDVVSGGKTGLFLSENLTKRVPARVR